MDDDLDSLLTGGPSAPPAAPAQPTAPTAPTAAPAAASDPMDEGEEEEEEDDDDTGVALVFDAPTGAPPQRGGGAFGTPINIKTQRATSYNRWGTPSATAATPATPSAPAAVVSSVSFAPLLAPSSVTAGVTAAAATAPAPAAAATSAARPFRLPLPNDNIFESGQNLDQRVDRPWTLPGADISDWFNYGFDEETWKLYCTKQIQQRINAKLQGKLNVFDGDDSAGLAMRPGMRPQPQPTGFAGGPRQVLPPQNMMHPGGGNMPMQPGMMGMPPGNMNMPPRPNMPFPPQQPMQRLAAFDDDASVPLGGAGMQNRIVAKRE